MSKETGGTAFPLPLGSETASGAEGMTLRDYFAAKILGATISRGAFLDTDGNMAKLSYRIADAMLEARK